MKVTFLGQGFSEKSPNAVGVYINKYLMDNGFKSFFCISAFASPLGIKLIDSIEEAKKTKDISIIVGIDQGGTSKEALNEILNLDVSSFVFYQRESPIFHPKIYLFEGDKETCLIIGSSNLTGKGLFINVECSIMIQFENDDKDGQKILDDLKIYFKSLFDFSDSNLFKLKKDFISDLEREGLIPVEGTRSMQHGKQKSLSNLNDKNVLDIPKRSSSKVPWIYPQVQSIFPKKGDSNLEELEIVGVMEDSERPKLDLLWESGPLTERDLNIPTGPNTNPTGSMLFKKGKMDGIDQRHYFRDEIFNELNWIADTKPQTSHIERSSAFFQIEIKGENFGVFELILNHDTNTNSKSYHQKQPMTNLRWGIVKKIIARPDLIGASAKLFRSSNPKIFLLEIE